MSTLSIEHSPANDRPTRYLRISLVWGLLAATLILFQDLHQFESRWSRGTLAVVHAFTIGVIGNAMLGSLLQFLPVAAGIKPRWGERSELIVYSLLNTGLVILLAGFLYSPVLLPLGGLMLVAAFGSFVFAALAGIRFDGRQTVLRAGLLVVFVCLLLTVILGLILTFGLNGLASLPLVHLTDIHAALGLVGTVVLLLGTVGSVVVPMFQGTKAVAEKYLLTWTIGTMGLLLISIILRAMNLIDSHGLAMILSIPILVFAIAILILQRQAPHKRNPTLIGFWRLGSIAILVSIIALIFQWPHSSMLPGILLIAIALPALIMGMLLEISAFLVWLQLQSERTRAYRPPSVDKLLPEIRKSILLSLHGITALSLVLASLWPQWITTCWVALSLVLAYGMTLMELFAIRRRAESFLRHVMKNEGITQ